jgi:NET1-associated nuclear protein 1 (U3 small nucleolar RNA-associated protein 17)
VDSTSNHIAAGDVTGRIVIWSGLAAAAAASAAGGPVDARNAGMTMATLHWHAHSVGALAFSHDGLYLLSGGQEAVLVIWQLETLKNTFLPRLGGPITHISRCVHDAARYAVCQENNAVRMVALSTMLVRPSALGSRSELTGAEVMRGSSAGCWFTQLTVRRSSASRKASKDCESSF